MICSVLIPSRARPARLRKTLQSVLDTAADRSAIETIVRIDDDDPESLDARGTFEALGAKVLIGPRKNGYASLAEHYTECAKASAGVWVWIMNDDAWIEGRGWDAQLAQIPTDGLIVQPEIYGLGPSRYKDAEGAAFPVVPNRSWERFGFAAMQDPADAWLDNELRLKGGWSTRFLKGISVLHDRDNDAALEAHRRL